MARSAAQVEAELQRLEVENENDSTSSNSLDYIDDSEVSVPYEDDASAMMNGDDAVLQRLEQQRRRELALLEQERQRLEQQLHPAAEEEITGDYTIGIVSSGSRKRKSREEDILEDIEMKMTEEEQRWARELKSAILQGDQEDDTPLRQIVAQNRITDMELAQHAIVSNGDIEESLKRIVHLDQHRKQYGINDTVAQGVESIQLLMQQHPGYLLSVDQCARHHYYVHVVDFAKFRPKEVQLPHDWKIFLRGMYYLQQCFNPTLAAVRNGILAIAECDGMGWDNFCLDFERRVWYEHCGSYPFKARRRAGMNCGINTSNI